MFQNKLCIFLRITGFFPPKSQNFSLIIFDTQELFPPVVFSPRNYSLPTYFPFHTCSISSLLSCHLCERSVEKNTMIRRQPPRFPPAIWNVHDATIQGEVRTNNACEAWNNGFEHLVCHSNPSLWSVITCLQKDNAIMETDVFRHTRGESITRQVYYFDVPYSLLGNQSLENQLFLIIIYNIIWKTTGGNNSQVKIAWEGIIPRWKTTGGNNSQVKKPWKGIIPRCQK